MKTLCGALLWSLFLLFALILHGKEEKKRLREYKALSHLIAHIKSSLLQAPLPLSSIFADFSDDALKGGKFLTLLREEGLPSALQSGVLSLEDEELAPFLSYAEGLGKRLYSEELLAADALIAKSSEIAFQKEAALPARHKLTGTLFFSGGMLVLLLLL